MANFVNNCAVLAAALNEVLRRRFFGIKLLLADSCWSLNFPCYFFYVLTLNQFLLTKRD